MNQPPLCQLQYQAGIAGVDSCSCSLTVLLAVSMLFGAGLDAYSGVKQAKAVQHTCEADQAILLNIDLLKSRGQIVAQCACCAPLPKGICVGN